MSKSSLSYQKHKDNVERVLSEKEERLYYVKNKECLYYQNQKQLFEYVNPFLLEKSSWLTIGDLQGTEANFFLGRGQDATASDISDTFLKEAQKEDVIKKYSQVNVEDIHFEDNSFDYVYCKEAYHHFPKAYVGLHEMIRCSKKATIIIEPLDIITKMPMLLLLKNLLDRINPQLINKFWKNRYSFETVGNYVYKVSEREIEKVAMGMALPSIAFKRLNILHQNFSSKVGRAVPMDKNAWKKSQRKLKMRNLLCRLHIIPFNTLCCVVFKEAPNIDTQTEMKKMGYEFVELPENPYLK